MSSVILSLALLVLADITTIRHTVRWIDNTGGILWTYRDYRDAVPDDKFKCGWIWFDSSDGSWHAVAYPDPKSDVLHYHTKKAAEDYVEKWCKP